MGNPLPLNTSGSTDTNSTSLKIRLLSETSSFRLEDWRIQKDALRMGVKKIDEYLVQLEDEAEDAELFIEKTFDTIERAIAERCRP